MAKVCQEKLLSILGRVLPTSSIDKIFEKKTSQKKEIGPILFFFLHLWKAEYGMLQAACPITVKK